MASKGGLPRSFEELIRVSDKPVLVDFWAEWCGPCRMVSPAVARIAREYRGRLLAVKINVDERPSVAARYRITAIPTIMLFRGGRQILSLLGAQPYEAIRSEVERALRQE